MTLGTDPQTGTALTLKERRPFSLTLTCEKQDKSRLDLAGASLSLVIAAPQYKGGAVQLVKAGTIVSAEDGTARFDVQASELDFGVGTYDVAITLTSAEGYASTIFESEAELTHNPDPTAPGDFSVVVPPLSLTARFRDSNKVTVKVNHHPDTVLLDAARRAETADSRAQLAASDADASAEAAFASAAAAHGKAQLAGQYAESAATAVAVLRAELVAAGVLPA